jgi:hypothetical protein
MLQGVRARNPLEILEFASESSERKNLEEFKGRRVSKSPKEGKFRRVDARVFGEGVLKSLERTVETLPGEVSICPWVHWI